MERGGGTGGAEGGGGGGEGWRRKRGKMEGRAVESGSSISIILHNDNTTPTYIHYRNSHTTPLVVPVYTAGQRWGQYDDCGPFTTPYFPQNDYIAIEVYTTNPSSHSSVCKLGFAQHLCYGETLF